MIQLISKKEAFLSAFEETINWINGEIKKNSLLFFNGDEETIFVNVPIGSGLEEDSSFYYLMELLEEQGWDIMGEAEDFSEEFRTIIIGHNTIPEVQEE